MAITSIDQEKLYSLNGEEPIQLPSRIRFANGLTKTDVTTFTIGDLESIGYSGPYTKPSFDPLTQTCTWSSTDFEWTVADIEFEKPSAEELLNAKDQNADFLLRKCDWVLLSDAGLTDTKVAEFVTYRQAVRDYAASVTSVPDVAAYEALSWPVAPTL
jgi:hypothetical protein